MNVKFKSIFQKNSYPSTFNRIRNKFPHISSFKKPLFFFLRCANNIVISYKSSYFVKISIIVTISDKTLQFTLLIVKSTKYNKVVKQE